MLTPRITPVVHTGPSPYAPAATDHPLPSPDRRSCAPLTVPSPIVVTGRKGDDA